MRWLDLSEDGETVVLRRFTGAFDLAPRPADADRVRRGVALDIETTGLDRQRDVIIEIALRPFDFDRLTGEVVAVLDPYCALEDPGRPLDPEVAALTGLTDADLAGQRIDWAAAAALLDEAHVVIAHNAAFDRPFVDARLGHPRKVWACSLTQIDWKAKGFIASKLELLTAFHGFFVGAHRAQADTDALLHLLTRRPAGTTSPYLKELLDTAREPSFMVEAVGSPFETKDLLKGRGYAWDGGQRLWFREVRPADLDAERDFLVRDVYRGRDAARVTPIAPHDRFRGSP